MSVGMLKLFRQSVIALLLCLITQIGFAADDLVTERAYYEDTTTQLTIEQVKQQVFTPYKGILTKRFTTSVYWLRITIAPSIASSSLVNSPLIMLVRPCMLDEIQLYDAPESALNPQITGDAIDAKTNLDALSRSLSFNFAIPRSDNTRYLWLRVKLTGPVLIDASVYTTDDFIKLNKQRELLYNFNIAILVCFIVWAFFHCVNSYDQLMSIFLVKQVINLIWFLFAFGYIRSYLYEYVTVNMIDKGTTLFIILSSMATLCFDCILFKEYDPLKRGPRSLLVLIMLFPIALLLFGFGYSMRSIQFVLTLSLIGTLFATIIAIRLTIKSDHSINQSPLISKNLLALAYIFIFMMVILSLLPVVNLSYGSEPTLHIRALHGLVSGFIMVYLLQIRSRYIEKTQQRQLDELSIKEKEIDSARQHQAAKSQFLAMLAHDLKTPLAVAKMVLGSKQLSEKQLHYVNQAISDMNNVIDRCLQVSELEENQVPLNIDSINLSYVLTELRQQSIGSERIQLIVDTDLTLQTDAQLLDIVLANLLDNANKYSQPESIVSILVKPSQFELVAGVEILILTSPGKAGWPDPEKIFTKYYRSQYASHLTGSGQGLYLASQLAKIMGGLIRYTPTQDQIGFVLWLPN